MTEGVAEASPDWCLDAALEREYRLNAIETLRISDGAERDMAPQPITDSCRG